MRLFKTASAFSALLVALGLAATAPAQAPVQQAPAENSAAGQPLTVQQRQQINQIAYQAGYEQGHEDAMKGAPYDYLSHPDYANGNQGYDPNSGIALETYRFDYRAGFQNGYDDGYYGRTQNPQGQPARTYSGLPAANPSAPSTGQQQTGAVPAGTVLHLKLNNSLSTSTSKAGDPFSATVAQPVMAPSGAELIPAGSIVMGKVGSVAQAGGLSGKSNLQLQFEQIRLPDGRTASLSASVSGVSSTGSGVGGSVGKVVQGSPTANTEGGVQQSRTRKTVGDVAAGGAVGALLGAVVGGGKGAAIGTAAGAGLGVVLASRSGSLNLPVDTPMTITLNSPLYLR